jgi:hypothetical protein
MEKTKLRTEIQIKNQGFDKQKVWIIDSGIQ